MVDRITKLIASKVNAIQAMTASMIFNGSKVVPISVIVPHSESRIELDELSQTIPDICEDGISPPLVCFTSSIDLWIGNLDGVSQKKLLFPESDSYESQASGSLRSSSGKLNQIKDIDKPCGSIVFIAGNELYGPIIDRIQCWANIYTIDHSYRFLMLDESFVEKELVSHFNTEFFAREYVRRIEASGMPEPIMLVGFSFGGVVALSIAKELKRRNVQILTVVMLDSWTPEAARSVPWFRRLIWHAKQISLQGAADLQRKIKVRLARGNRRLPRAKSRRRIRMVYDRDLVKKYDYSVRYPEGAYLFRTNSNAHYVPKAEDYGWNKFVSKLNVIKMAGAHGNLINEKADEIAGRIDEIWDGHTKNK